MLIDCCLGGPDANAHGKQKRETAMTPVMRETASMLRSIPADVITSSLRRGSDAHLASHFVGGTRP